MLISYRNMTEIYIPESVRLSDATLEGRLPLHVWNIIYTGVGVVEEQMTPIWRYIYISV